MAWWTKHDATSELGGSTPGWLGFVQLATVAEFVVAMLYVGVRFGAGAAGGAVIFGGGMYASGLLIGFLFGHPRWIEATVVGNGPTGKSKPSTNLEKVSDWLTTLIVGLTLVQFEGTINWLWRIVTVAAPTIAPGALGIATAATIAILFAVTGFLLGYLYTRLKLQDEFDRDRLAEEPEYLEGVMNAYLYRDPPESFRKALAAASEYETRFPGVANYRVYLQIAIAHAQEYMFYEGRLAGGGPQADAAKKACLQALADAYSREPACIEFLHSMWEPMLAPSTENDLMVLRADTDFQAFFRAHLPATRVAQLRTLTVPIP